MKYNSNLTMNIRLSSFTPIRVVQEAIRTSHNSSNMSDTHSMDKVGKRDLELIKSVGNTLKHSSVLEHVYYTFEVKGVSRALLQELVRHRIASYTVKSTRYTLNDLKKETTFYSINNGQSEWVDFKRASKYLVYTSIEEVDKMSIRALENLRLILISGIHNDRAKYCLPESYKTDLYWTINMRSLQNFLSLRSSVTALWEIREFAIKLYETLPVEHRFMFIDSLHGYTYTIDEIKRP